MRISARLPLLNIITLHNDTVDRSDDDDDSLPLLNHNDAVDRSDDGGDDTNVQTYELLYRQRIQKESTDDKEQNNTYTTNSTLSNIYYINDFHDNSKHLYTNRFLYMLWEPIDYGE